MIVYPAEIEKRLTQFHEIMRKNDEGDIVSCLLFLDAYKQHLNTELEYLYHLKKEAGKKRQPK